MPTKIIAYKKTLKDGTVKTYTYEKEVEEKGPPKKRNVQKHPVSKKALNDLIKGFSRDELAKLMIVAREIAGKKSSHSSDDNADSDEDTQEITVTGLSNTAENHVNEPEIQ